MNDYKCVKNKDTRIICCPKETQSLSTDFQRILGEVYDLLPRANFSTTRKFFLGIIYRINNVQLLLQVIRVLSAVKQKDFTYSRSQCNSSLLIEHKIFSPNQTGAVENQLNKIWNWFSSFNLKNKACFFYSIANEISDSSILYQGLNLAKTLHTQLSKKMLEDDASIVSENTFLSSDNYSFHTDEHPDIYLLASVNPHYKSIDCPVSESLVDYSQESFEDLSIKSEDDSFSNSSFDPHLLVVSHSQQALIGVTSSIDFISKLPIHLSKKIIAYLDLHSQSNAALVKKQWHDTVRQVQAEQRTRREIFEEAVMMQGVSSKGAHPNYAKKKMVSVPVFSTDQQKRVTMEQLINCQSDKDHTSSVVIPGVTISQFESEERNVYCGSYNVLILDKRRDKYRVMHYNGGNVIASGSCDCVIHLFDVRSGREILPSIRGHPGSIKSLYVGDNDKNFIYSGSYDTTIRRWHLGSSSCHQIMHGHSKSIITLDCCNELLVSGSKDGLVKIWNIKTGTSICSFRHANTAFVTCVKIDGLTVISSCDRGVIKVWDLKRRKLLKSLIGHTDAISQVSMDKQYIVSASHDEYVFTWVREGNVSLPIKSYRHPKQVLCVVLRYLRIISGCADGKIRVLHIHTGECLRVIRGNSKCEPVLSLCATSNRLIVNMESNLMLLQFEELELNYEIKYDQGTENNKDVLLPADQLISHPSFSNYYVRACRNRASSITCSSIRHRPVSAPVKQQLPLLDVKRPLSSVAYLKADKSLISNSVIFQHPKSGCSIREKSGRKSRRDSFNIHNSKPMSVISNMSSVIMDEDTLLHESFYRKPPFVYAKKTTNKPSINKEKTLTRNRLHLRIGSIHHNIKNSPEDINTALNGAHPDVREVYHSIADKM